MAIVTTGHQDKELSKLLTENLEIHTFNAGLVLEWVELEFSPEDIFEASVLEQWAIDNGFVSEGETE